MPERFFVPNNIVVILVLVLFMLTDFVATATQSRRQPAVQDDRGPIRRRSIIRTNKIPGFPDKIGLHSENFALNKPSYEQPKQLKIMNRTKIGVLLVLCLQNSVFTVLRRYSQGILQETYSSHEVLMAAEVVKMAFSAWMIGRDLPQKAPGVGLVAHLGALVRRSRKMLGLALLYGAMNILSFVALRNIGAGTFTICAQMKILTTAAFSSLLLGRRYSATKWRALLQLILGVLLFSAPAFEGGGGGGGHGEGGGEAPAGSYSQAFLGTAAVLIEVTLSGFASIYFEKVLKKDTEGLSIWERNFQLALWSVPVYVGFIGANGGGAAGYGGGWSPVAVALAGLGAAGGLLVALSIKHGDSILKTLATTGAITVSAALDHLLLGGPLTNVMVLAAAVVVLAICNYTFDATPAAEGNGGAAAAAAAAGGAGPGSAANKARASEPPSQSGRGEDGGGSEGAPMLPRQNSELVARPARGGKDSKV